MPSGPVPNHPFRLRAHPHLYEINAWAWLEELSARQGRRITLADVPDSDWDALARLGFDFVWLMGVWTRSPASRRFFRTNPESFAEYDQALPGWRLSDVVGSPYAVADYRPDPRIGTWAHLDQAREKLHARNIALILDFVPNHTALDHLWVVTHPEYYISGAEEDFRKNPSAFFLLEIRDKILPVAYGKDPHFSPWRDVAQLNHYQPAARAALIVELREIARHCDGVRCDMAMLVLDEICARTWGPLINRFKAPAEEFWTSAIAAVPDFVWLAEVYWNFEPRLQQLGFQFAYDKTFYDLVRANNPAGIRGHLQADLVYQGRLARFLENHDEERSAAVFGPTRLEAAGTLTATLPGMRFYHHGQLEGRKIHLPIPLSHAADERSDPPVRAFYEKILRITNAPVFHAGQWKLLEMRSAGDDTFENFVAYEWRLENKWKVVVANLGASASQGRLILGPEIAASKNYVFFDELHDVRYPRSGGEIARLGLYIRLDAFHAHLFDVSPI